MELNEQKLIIGRKLQAQAIAVIQQAIEANIPENELRIGPEKFKNLLDKDFHPNFEELTKSIYLNSNFLINKSFVLIDGGDMYSRKRAGFALLFRLISLIAIEKPDIFRNIGLHVSCSELCHKLQSINLSEELSRNDYSSLIKSYKSLFISECDKRDFKPHFDSGAFFDEIMSFREGKNKTTILSFILPLAQKLGRDDNVISDLNSGQYISMFSKIDLVNNNDKFLRIRVKS